MIELGRILKTRIGKNRDATQTTQLFQTQLTEDNDVQETEEMHISGVQYNPPVNSTSFISRISSAFKFVVGINDNIPKLTNLNPGERKAYGSKDGGIVCSLWYKDDGTIQIDTDKDLDVNCAGNVDVNATNVNIIASAEVNITAPDDVNITGDVKITGDVAVTGKIEATADVVADSGVSPISILGHRHPYTWTDPAGSGTTGIGT